MWMEFDESEKLITKALATCWTLHLRIERHSTARAEPMAELAIGRAGYRVGLVFNGNAAIALLQGLPHVLRKLHLPTDAAYGLSPPRVALDNKDIMAEWAEHFSTPAL